MQGICKNMLRLTLLNTRINLKYDDINRYRINCTRLCICITVQGKPSRPGRKTYTEARPKTGKYQMQNTPDAVTYPPPILCLETDYLDIIVITPIKNNLKIHVQPQFIAILKVEPQFALDCNQVNFEGNPVVEVSRQSANVDADHRDRNRRFVCASVNIARDLIGGRSQAFAIAE